MVFQSVKKHWPFSSHSMVQNNEFRILSYIGHLRTKCNKSSTTSTLFVQYLQIRASYSFRSLQLSNHWMDNLQLLWVLLVFWFQRPCSSGGFLPVLWWPPGECYLTSREWLHYKTVIKSHTHIITCMHDFNISASAQSEIYT